MKRVLVIVLLTFACLLILYFIILILFRYLNFRDLFLTLSDEYREALRQRKRPKVQAIDVSDIYVISPQKSYSLRISKPGADSTYLTTYMDQPFEGNYIDTYNFKIEGRLMPGHDSGKRLRYKDHCNERGILEKKTLLGWYELDRQAPCSEDNVVGSDAFSKTFDKHLNLEGGVMGTSSYHYVDITGIYRMKLEFMGNCKEYSHPPDARILPSDCAFEAVSYSPEFKIIK